VSIGEEFFQKLFEKDLFISLFLNAKNKNKNHDEA
jgi:hypothetical protein